MWHKRAIKGNYAGLNQTKQKLKEWENLRGETYHLKKSP
jgi:hypothetical protein